MRTRAALLSEFGGPEQFHLETTDLECSAPDEAIVRVMACGINFHDIDIRRGASGRQIRLPLILGREIAGSIEVPARDGSGPPVGTQVAVLYFAACGSCENCITGADHMCRQLDFFGVTRNGGYAQHAVVPTRAIMPLPDGLDPVLAAAGQITFSTALHSILERGSLQPGETVLITGATGGVGSASIQVALKAGATCLAAAGTPEKAQKAIELGASTAFVLSAGGLDPYGETFRQERSERVVDLVVDTAGGDYLVAALSLLKPGGRVVIVGAHGGEVVPVDLVNIFRNEHSLVGSARAPRRVIEQALSGIAQGVYTPWVTERGPLGSLSQIHREMEERLLVGKAVIEPNQTQ